MAAKRDYYEVLGVTKTSSPNEIKQQYRKLALKFHLDRNQSSDAGEHFKEISEAYAVISDPEKNKSMINMAMPGVYGRYSSEDIFQGIRGGGFDSNDVWGCGVTKVVPCIFLVNTMKQSNVMIKR